MLFETGNAFFPKGNGIRYAFKLLDSPLSMLPAYDAVLVTQTVGLV